MTHRVKNIRLQEKFRPFIKYFHLMIPVPFKVLPNFLYRLLFSQSRFRVKFICKTDYFLFEALGPHISLGNRQPAINYGLKAKAGPRMSLAHQSMFRVSFRSEQLLSQVTVAYIRKSTVTGYMGCFRHENPYIVQHSCLLDKTGIHCQFRMITCYRQCLIGNIRRVRHINVVQFRTLFVIFIYYSLYIHKMHPHSRAVRGILYKNNIKTPNSKKLCYKRYQCPITIILVARSGEM